MHETDDSEVEHEVTASKVANDYAEETTEKEIILDFLNVIKYDFTSEEYEESTSNTIYGKGQGVEGFYEALYQAQRTVGEDIVDEGALAGKIYQKEKAAINCTRDRVFDSGFIKPVWRHSEGPGKAEQRFEPVDQIHCTNCVVID
ncbi:hypothetical protein RUM43_000159 [Polyplax serrata]|uniref:Uncharacterized protein n=1 Tax=Polyplax serrata TaxID=468196 RepID=A0AAN8SDF2_POLSC